jgi:PAS domain-containing protein
MDDPQYGGSPFSGPRDVVDVLLGATTTLAIVGEDLQGRVVLWNRGAESLYGCTAAAAVGALIANDLHPPSIVASGLPARMRRRAGGGLGDRHPGAPAP